MGCLLPNWQDIAYLQVGSPAQRAVYYLLQQHAVLPSLRAYAPVLAGTFPLDIAVAGSDLDVLCEVYDFETFSQTVMRHFSHLPGYASQHLLVNDQPAIVISFQLPPVEIELFGQALPVERQHGFRHLVVEARLLAAGGAALKQAVVRLKAQGLKTEPAFAQLLALPGDAYQALLALEPLSDAQLCTLVQRAFTPAPPC